MFQGIVVSTVIFFGWLTLPKPPRPLMRSMSVGQFGCHTACEGPSIYTTNQPALLCITSTEPFSISIPIDLPLTYLSGIGSNYWSVVPILEVKHLEDENPKRNANPKIPPTIEMLLFPAM